MGFPRNRITIFGVLSFIILVGGYLAINRGSDANPGSDSPRQVEVESGPIRFTMALNKTRYRLGEKVEVALTIKNIGNESIFVSSSTSAFFDVVVYDGSTKVWQATKYYAYAQYVWSMKLKPNEEFGRKISWTETKRIGIYDIVGSIWEGAGCLTNKGGINVPSTPPITIQIGE